MSIENFLSFPKKNSIIAYLEKHPLTNKKVFPYLTDKKIIQKVAEVFAESEASFVGVQVKVLLTTHEMNEELNLHDKIIEIMNTLITAALRDCVKSK